ncbi:SH3 domain-containing protein [Variovorax paradoxus]|uniref:SH3 domain-containing protein n=1 Tax=Variovorax paradoxus TaxID=34073 RepID=UPI0003796559|nr:SH3 domain-containing protein [Variovorax paradoxus]
MAIPNPRLADILKSFEIPPRIGNIFKILEPSQRIGDVISTFETTAIARDAERWAKLTESLKIPTLDLAASAAIAKLWGPDGMRRQLELLDVEESAINALVPAPAAGGRSHLPGEDLMSRQVARISLSNWVAIISALFALWVWMESQETDKEIDAIKDGVAQSNQRLAAMEMLLKSVLSQSKVPHEHAQEFVARSRVVLIRKAGKHGAGVVAEALPNQTVELVSEDGKWIEVRYFDWNAHEERIGWALKKYFKRVERLRRD